MNKDIFKKQLEPKPADGLDKFRFGADDIQYPIMEIGIDSIDVEPQVRIEFDETELEDLCRSIVKAKELGVPYGLLQPILVTIKDPVFKRYKLEVGERRYRAFKKLGEHTIPAIIIDKSVNTYLLQLYENVHRKNLHIIEKANGVFQYVLVELAKHDDVSYDGSINDLIRQTVIKMNFKRKLDDTEQTIALILEGLKIPVNTLRNWFYATSFPESVQKFFIQKRVPVNTIQKLVSLAKKPETEIINAFKKELGIDEPPKPKQKVKFLSRTKLATVRRGLEQIISSIKKDESLDKDNQEFLDEILVLTKELKELTAKFK